MAAFVYDDGGREAAGFRGDTGDCVTRAIAIATGAPYREVYDVLAARQAAAGKPRSARNGIERRIWKALLLELGWLWTPTMQIGSGCRVHLRADELPGGTLIVQVTRHIVAVVDGVIHDTYDPSRDGTRCVYGYFAPPAARPCGDEPGSPTASSTSLPLGLPGLVAGLAASVGVQPTNRKEPTVATNTPPASAAPTADAMQGLFDTLLAEVKTVSGSKTSTVPKKQYVRLDTKVGEKRVTLAYMHFPTKKSVRVLVPNKKAKGGFETTAIVKPNDVKKAVGTIEKRLAAAAS